MAVLMRSVSGIRGIVGSSLTPEVLVSHLRAFLEITQAEVIVLGRDSRPTGLVISDLVQAVCRMAGVKVIDIGLATTPTVALAVEIHRAQGGIILTASHNPIEWNALKFLNQEGMFLGPKEIKELFELADAGSFRWAAWNAVTAVVAGESANQAHIDGVLQLPFVDLEAIKKAQFKVAIDAVNGAGSHIVPQLLEALGCEVVPLYCEPDGLFPRGAEPLAENLQDLGELVREQKCHVGFALDPDADRCALVDSQGVAVGEEYTLAIAADTVLEREKRPMAINLSTSRMNDDVAAKHGVPCFRSPVGEIHVSLAMIAEGCVIGGEGNGGVILPALHYGRDSLVAIALVLDWMARHQKKVEDFVQENIAYAMPKKKFDLGNTDLDDLFAQVLSKFPDWKIDRRDGLWLSKDKSWLHVRASNTEPVVRVIAEAPSSEYAEELCAQVELLLKS
ncbi:MAG: phosphoglucosamine mutase [Fibrobacter sp.]|nr:phosphoglucosamine mutase [Fibrobacter sp.]